MRLVVTSDTHKFVDPTLIPDGDVFLHCGDLTRWGDPEEWKEIIPWLAAVPHKTKIMIAGNHDFHIHHYPGPALQQLRMLNVTVIGLPNNPNYMTYTLPNDMRVLGLPYVTDLPRWAFNTTDSALDELAKTIEGPIDIIMSHSPPYGILDRNIGIKSYTDTFLPKFKPKHWFMGHVHEEYGIVNMNETQFYNVCMCDRAYEHANSPIVIDID